jgi:Peptidase family C25
MKKLFLPALLVLSLTGFSQPYNNSWIDYTKTYYKFKVGSTGLYRISQSALTGIGLDGTPAEQFQIWRNGEEVRIYTSSSTGPLGGTGYIEFWGVMNDGKKDTKLYLSADYQLSDHWSLETDTAAYFLTINTSGTNLRFVNAPNNIAGTTLSPEPYFMNTRGTYYKNRVNSGYAVIIGFYVYSSSYDIGEGYTSNDISPGFDLTSILDKLNLYPTGPPASFRIGASGNAISIRNLKVKLANTVILDEPMSDFSYLKREVNNIPLSAFTSPDVMPVYVQNSQPAPPVTTDRMVVSFLELTYPAKFNFNNRKDFYFTLPATAVGNYLVIDNFNYGSTAPVLLDLNTGSRYTGDISTAGKVKIVLPPSSDTIRKFVLVNEDGSNTNTVSNFLQRNFVNYGNSANQANYIIVSNTALFNNGGGINYVDQYKAYRSSAAGGSFNAKIFDIDQLTDQFGFGIKKHPFSVKDFVQYAKNNFSSSPEFIFLIGKGVSYNEYAVHESNPFADKLNLVPTYGYPASDNLLTSGYNSVVPDIPVGRLSATSGNEVGYYLEKMKQYETAQASATQTVSAKGWMKSVVHVIGGANIEESDLFKYYMDSYKNVIQDTSYGGKVETFSKSSTAAVQLIGSQRIEQLFNEGIGLLSYFGHSSANTLEFNLSSPQSYQENGKYPFFNVSGCTAGNNYAYDTLRNQGILTLSEQYVLSNQRGSIGFLASTHLGIPPYLNAYNNEFYKDLGVTHYGSSIGIITRNVIKNLGGAIPTLLYYTRINLEEINLHGDPALKINPHPKPDYIIEEPMVKINPSIVSVADNSFTINIDMLNIGKAINDTIRIVVKRQLPNDSIIVLYNKLVPAIKCADSIMLTANINPITDKGLNKIIVILDADNKVEELSELNNTITKEFYIFEDEVRPVYPYNFSIMNQQNINFYGSTANPLTTQRQILMEIDTTELFTSPFKKSYNTTGTGGVIQFTPSISYTDNKVYYWRMGMASLTGPVIWNNSSFIYLANSLKGFNQSHYFQHLKSSYQQMYLDADGVFKFNIVPRSLTIKTGLYPYFGYDQINVILDFDYLERYGCKYSSLQFLVYDSSTLAPWHNYNIGSDGRFGSWPICSAPYRTSFEFPYADPTYRKRAMDFLDSIPVGKYVSITNLGRTINKSFINQWKADTLTLGSGKSLYHKLKSLGFTQIDSFTSNKPFLFLYMKGAPDFAPKQVMGATPDEYIDQSFVLSSKYKNGEIESPLFGPAKAWKELHWRGADLEPAIPDTVAIEVYGVNTSGTKVKLATVYPANDTSLAFINAATYPYLQLKMLNSDQTNATPNQLTYWRVNADYVPEGAIAPNIYLKMKDTVEIGQDIDFAVAFRNISETAFDSLKLKFIITDRNNVPHQINLPKKKALPAGDTLIVSYTIDTKEYNGINTLYVEVNPDNDQPEQYHFNNFLYKNFYVRGDQFNPLLDVTFDGVHILNRDIVSARPHIVVKLKDESKFLALNDTSLLKVQLRYPDGSLRTFRFDNDTMRFTPANLATGENTATIDLMPNLVGNDDEYELIVSGKDAAGNKAGNLDYMVSFMVISKSMISNLLNYPNPFTTSTAFVFTVTGSQVPQNVRIQILTITGKIVREITKDELGPLHIGRNITDFKWDGTDMYGQRLANGVYLYRMIANLNGQSIDSYKEVNDKIAKGDGKSQKGYDFFVKGYGKMYLMK